MKQVGRQRKTAYLSSPGNVVCRVFILLSILWFTLPWLYTLGALDACNWYGTPPAQAYADLRSICQRLDAGHEFRMAWLFPEGRLFSYSFYGFSLVNIAHSNPSDSKFRNHAISELRRLIPIIEHLSTEPPFDKSAMLIPKGGIIPISHANLLRAGYIFLQKQNSPGWVEDSIVADFHRDSQILFDALSSSAVACVETYPGETWPVDSLMGLLSLKYHDDLFSTEYRQAVDRWAGWMTAHLDLATGLLPMEINQSGRILQGARGCGLSWSLAILPFIAPDLAKSQYELYRQQFFVYPPGIAGIREWPRGIDGFEDADSGPIVFGIGAGASGIGLAAAKANGDVDSLTRFLRGHALSTLPAYSPPTLGRSTLLGQVLLADELALWGMTNTPWGTQSLEGANKPLSHQWAFWSIFILIATLVLWEIVRCCKSVGRAYRSAKQNPARWATVHRFFFAFQVLIVIAWFTIPQFIWLAAIALSMAGNAIETRMQWRRQSATVE